MPVKSSAPAKLSDKAIAFELERILHSKAFSQVDRLKRFLTFIVSETTSGHGTELKEYVIGVQVFGKDPSFDPRTDPIVRVQARRLRTRLSRYYREEGQHDDIIVDLPKGGYTPVFRRRETPAPAKPSLGATVVNRNTVAVSMFADHSPAGEFGYFAQGLRAEIVHRLTALRGVRVMSSTREPSAELAPGAALVVEGSIRGSRERLRLIVHLVDRASGQYVWSESVDVVPNDAIAAQESIAQTIGEKLASMLLDAEHKISARQASENLAARNLYLQGRYHLDQRTEEGLQKAVEFFEKALVEDAQFSLAHSGLADAYGLLAHYGVLGPADVWAKTASSAASAVILDGHSAEAHTSLAHVRATQDWDWLDAQREFLRAIELNPRYPTARHWYAMSCLVPLGRIDDALEQIVIAQSLDPVSSIIAREVAVIHLYRRDYDAALEQCDQTIELNPHFALAYLTLGLIQEQRGDFDESAAAFRRAVDLVPHSPRMQAALARTLALSGKHDNARATLTRLTDLASTRYVSPFEFVTICFAIGDLDAGYAWLTKACADRCFELLALRLDPRFDALRGDPRFEAITQRVGLT
jgi:TolB-like protein